ncbi:uncharacterized protein LODBEIA_P10360 [Lodderomyces beijingensis]|uniref:Glycoside hydrolase family 3 N-terminal domain-containing protein n=1 Tax=Lodderomyces beijingensis TaxID=1775926 RepID=A0ABP0ZKW2_9ASCO
MEKHAGQLLCGGFEGTKVTPQAYHLIVEQHVSTMILSRKNAVSVEQTMKLINDLQYIAFTQGKYKHPIMFAIDEEGGLINSLFDPEFLTQSPGAMALAATGDPHLVYEVSKAVAVELKTIGFSIILGPVLDVVTKLSHQLVGVRSFGTTLEEVKTYGSACARGLKDGGLFTVGKHFPGIGNATVDSLLELPMIGDTLAQVKQFNTVPFEFLIEKGLIDGVSVAGCGVPNISPDETHACLSPLIINHLLRRKFKFDGVVISECLEMEALYHSIGLGQGVILAINAGCDLVMVCHDPRLQDEAIEAIKKGVLNGNLEDEMITASFKRIETLQKRLPKWTEIFPQGAASAKQDPVLFKNSHPETWKKHQALADLAYQKSITLVRDFNNVLPLSRHFQNEENESILVLSPLLSPIKWRSASSTTLFAGEEVFQGFGMMLSNHPSNSNNKNSSDNNNHNNNNKGKSFRVLHTTYTANGLTKLHEQLIEKAKVVIVFTSEASRNMYQIGLVKYVSMLCGANPSSNASRKPMIVIATSSPYDFLNDSKIGSAYLCCYDYTNEALGKVVGLLMGDFEAEGCIPGERKENTPRERQSSEGENSKQFKRRWLVDEFDLKRDFASLVKLWRDEYEPDGSDTNEYLDRQFYKRLHALLATSDQKHFVVRNSSLNILYGVVLTWVEAPIGHIVYIIVEKSKRAQSIGKNLNARAVRYLTKEKQCREIRFGSSFPLLIFPGNKSAKIETMSSNIGWGKEMSAKKHIMLLNNLDTWQVPSRILKELMIVGVRFDICNNTEQLQSLIKRSPEYRSYYHCAVESLQFRTPNEVKIIIALEPNTQGVIGSIILFTNKSKFSKYYPFIDQCVEMREQEELPLVGGIIAPMIDQSYSNLMDIFKYGLICSAITFLKNANEDVMQCLMIDVKEEKSLTSLEDIGFHIWRSYYDYYDRKMEKIA